MAWNLSGTWIEVCSCKMYCRCNLGPAEPDQGWCSGAMAFAVDKGASDGVDLSRATLAVSFELPGDFLGGIDTARLYFNDGASEDQRRELEAIFTGKKGGPWEALNAGIKTWLAPKVARIAVDTGDKPSFTVGDIGVGVFERMKNSSGKQATVVDAPLSEAFQVPTQELALANGSRWDDPDMRGWESLGYGAVVSFSWNV